MKRTKKIIRKPDLAEESSGGSDSDEVLTPLTKKGKAKGKKLITPKPEETDETPEKPKQNSKNARGKVKKTIKLQEPATDFSLNSDSDDETTEKPNQTTKSAKGMKKRPAKLQDLVKDSLQDSDSDSARSARSQTKKKVGKGKNAKPSKPAEESSETDSEEEPSTANKAKVKKVLKKPEPVEEPSESLESEENVMNVNPEPNPNQPMEEPLVADAIWRTEGASMQQRPIKYVKESKIKGKKDLYVSKPEEANHDLSDGEQSSDMEYGSSALFNPKRHKQCLQDLENTDPSFYKFLQKHDAELLEFDENDDGLDEKEGDDDFEEVHVPGELHGGSDESDFEADDEKQVKGKVTLKMVEELEIELFKKEGKVKLSSIIKAVKLFNAAVRRATSEDGNTDGEYKVAGSSVFNRVINMCVLYLPWGIRRYLGMDDSGKNPLKCKHFVKIKGTLVQYLNDLIKLLEAVTSENILVVMLKHLHQMARYVACFTRIAKKAIKRILPLWSSGDETVRVLAFICILRITRSQQVVVYEAVLKAMFMTYVRNSKFVSPTTWPGINFMRRSLAEMFMLDLDVAYPLVFLYIRQLGIHLRNAIMVPKKDHKLAVYNWQYINSLHLWAVLLQHSVHNEQMKSLLFPLSMIISNTIKLVPTPQYYPLRFHLTEILMDMTRDSGVFIPVMGFLVDVLMKFDFNKKHKKASMKPLDFSCLIRLNKSQMSEHGFKDAVVERLYAVALHYATDLSSTLAFPDLIVILIVYLRDVVHKCTIQNHKKKLKQLLEKLEEGSEYMRKLRVNYKLSFRDVDALRGWEAKVKAEGTPLMTYFENWRKINNIQKRKISSKNDELAACIPSIKRKKVYDEAEELFKDNTAHPMTLFPSDSEDEIDHFKDNDENKTPTKEQKVTKKMQKQKIIKDKLEIENPDTPDVGDIVQEFSASDW